MTEEPADKSVEIKPVGKISRRTIEVLPILQPPVQYVVFEEDGRQPVGYVLITASIEHKSALIGSAAIKTAAIWHIYVEPSYRGKGFGKDLLGALKMHYDHIYSFGLTDEGRKLLLSVGFVRDELGDIKGDKMYRWRKGKL